MPLNKIKNKKQSSDGTRSAGKSIAIIIFCVAVLVGIGFLGFNILKENVFTKEPYSVVDESTGKESFYDEDGKFIYSITREYYDKEKTILKKETHSDADNSRTKSTVYKSDGKTIDYVEDYSKNRISSRRFFENGEDSGRHIDFAYDSQGNEICAIEYGKDGKAVSKKEQSYNAKGMVESCRMSDGEGSLISRTEYQYNDKGQVVKETLYDISGVTGYKTFEYDKDGKIIKTENHSEK